MDCSYTFASFSKRLSTLHAINKDSVAAENQRNLTERAISSAKVEISDLVDIRLTKYDNQLSALFIVQTNNHEMEIIKKAIDHMDGMLKIITQIAPQTDKNVLWRNREMFLTDGALGGGKNLITRCCHICATY